MPEYCCSCGRDLEGEPSRTVDVDGRQWCAACSPSGISEEGKARWARAVVAGSCREPERFGDSGRGRLIFFIDGKLC